MLQIYSPQSDRTPLRVAFFNLTSGVSCPLVTAGCAVSCSAAPWPGPLTVSEPSGLWSSSYCGPAQWPGPESCQCLHPGKWRQKNNNFPICNNEWRDHKTQSGWKHLTLLPLRLPVLLPVLGDTDSGDRVLWKNTLLGSSAVSDCVDRFLCWAVGCSSDGSLTL